MVISARRSDLVIVDKMAREAVIVDMVILNDTHINDKKEKK